jgi:diguanylate cyclase (GGDEF)-like protein
LLFGDVIFALGEVGRFVFPQVLLEVPYLFVPACISAAVLHPSIRFIARPNQRRQNTLGTGRLVAVGAALLAPIIVVATNHNSHSPTASIVLCLILAVTAILRLASAMREQAALEARLSHQATHDELTGLPSRSLIITHIDQMLATSTRTDKPVSVMFIDLDQFKLVNDSMGHSMGDQLLVQASRRIASCLRPGDVVGRISGDEFIVVVGLDAMGAFSFGERIRRSLSDSFFLDSGEVFISVSIGVTVALPSDGSQAATLIQEADTAMYRSKDSGRNRVTIFDSSMRERVARRVELERRLRHALNERHFAAFYQPLVSLPNGKVNGFEALARWQEDGQMISPAEFIPIAEESGLIVPLGAFMLDEACRNIAIWRKTIVGGDRLYVTVNLSARQIRESDIVDTVAETLERYHLPGQALWLEITESVMMEDSVLTASVMAGLRALGVRLAVDDFGTGFSSLSYLKRFPVSSVKIDRSFVTGLGQHEADSSLVTAIIAMGSALDLNTIAEGVETTEEAQHLYSLGCRQAQGYLFGKAVSSAEVPAALQRLGVAQNPKPPAARRCTTSSTRG